MSKKKKITPLTEEQKKLVEDNVAYAFWYAGKLCKLNYWLPFEDAKELTYYTLVEAATKYNPNKSKNVDFFGFLRVLTKRAVIDLIRKRKNERKHLPTVRLDECHSVPAEDNSSLWEAINALEETNREILFDYYFYGLSQPEIAAKNNISTAAVCSQLQRTLKKIKSELC